MLHTVLVIDDDPDVARGLARSLVGPNRRVLTAGSCQEALTALSKERVDVIVSDDLMPEMTGRQLFRRLKQSHPDVVRILMTGHPTLESALETINQEEAHRYLTKPFAVADLDSEITQALLRVRQNRQHKQARVNEGRRRELLAALEREHPGLTSLPPSPLQPMQSALGAELLHRLDQTSAAEPLPLGPQTDVLRLADQLLLLPIERPRAAVTLEPSPTEVRIVVDSGTSLTMLAVLSSDLGDALAARLALLGGLDLAVAGNQQGRVEVRSGSLGAEVLIALRTSAVGLSIELRRLLAAREFEVPPSEEYGGVGPYRMGDVLGEGGLGIVHRAFHVHLEREVAIKVMKASASSDPIAAARLLREARAASRARSEGVVDVLDYGRLPDQRPFIVMELVTAPTLEQVLAGGPLPIEKAVQIARNIAQALGAAHEAGVVHRDLKPSNVFVDEELRIKISDFGAAKLLNDSGPQLTQEGMTIGTPNYMPPEQARGEPVDRRADIYALGCVLFEMLTGSPPFDGETSMQVVTKHVLQAPPTVTSPHGPLPLALVRTVSRALAKQRAERHQNTSEFIGDVDQALVALRRTGWRKWLQ